MTDSRSRPLLTAVSCLMGDRGRDVLRSEGGRKSDQQGVDRPDADRRFGKNWEAVAEVRSEGVSTGDSIITRPSQTKDTKAKGNEGAK